MMDRLDPKVLLSAGLGLVLAGFLAYYLIVIKPVTDEAHRLKTQLESALRDRDMYQTQLKDKQTQITTVSDEITRLKLFDLRTENAFDAALANRSNLGLIALSEILQRHNITIEALTPGPTDPTKITVQQNPNGGVLHRRYIVRAQGRYEDVQAAFSAFKSLPPALDIDYYDIQYIGAEGNRARVFFELGFGFNFLVTTQQLDQFSEMASASLAASSSLPFSFPAGVFGGASSSVAPQAAPAAPAAPASPSSEVMRPSGWYQAIATWLDPAAEAAPATTVAKPTAKPTPKPTMTLRAYTFSVDKGINLGRAEPFLPLGEARVEPVKLAKPILAPARPAAPLPEAAVLAVLLSNDGPATALLQYGNERMRVRPGSLLTGGAQVAAIGRDFVLIRYQGTLHRIGLQTESSMPVFNAPPPSQPSPASMRMPQVPVPEIPRVPMVQGQ
ncbi:MAG TPA: hypothetical protein V6D05_14975 [Stenomitos sp.]